MINTNTIKVIDGDDEIVFSESFNVYNNSLIIEGVSGLNITFNFDLINFLKAVARMQQAVGQLAIIGKEQYPFTLTVEPANRK